MRLAAKFTIALVGALAILLAVQGWWHYQQLTELHAEQAQVWTQVLTTALVIVIAAAISFLLGVWLIGRPVERVFEQARRAREQLGDQRRASAALQEQLRHADRLSTVGRVASGIAHELGTPLNVVAGRAAMINSETDDPELREHATIIAEQAERMTGIIRELLDFSRRRQLERAETRLVDVIDQATTLLEPIADSRDVDITVEPLGELTAKLDVNKTLQVLTNLMMNAVQAMPEGGTMTIGARTEQVDHPRNDHAEPGEYLAITVTDQGVGIPDEALERIFRPFFTTKQKGRGTGLGLYVCQGIVRDQAGWIDVGSVVGQGTTFTVYLPREDDAPKE